jgi:hypothetical protein
MPMLRLRDVLRSRRCRDKPCAGFGSLAEEHNALCLGRFDGVVNYGAVIVVWKLGIFAEDGNPESFKFSKYIWGRSLLR